MYEQFRSDSIHDVLIAAASADPAAPAVSFVGGASLTRGELLAEVRALAGGLAQAGVGPGDRVVLLIGNRLEFLTTYFALSMLGAVSVPLNTALRGDVLTYMLDTVKPYRLVAESSLAAAALPSVEATGGRERLWCVPDGTAAPDGALDFEELLQASPLGDSYPTQPWDLASILFTSGTTGRSKGVMWSQRTTTLFADNATAVMGYTPDDVVYTCLPLFHINALHSALLAALREGASAVVSPRFSGRRFWAEIRESGATVANMLGAMGSVLWKQAPSPAERDHALRLAMVVPYPTSYYKDFEQRFGILTTELYGSTDTGIPIGVPHGERRPGSCGKPLSGWAAELVDEYDEPVPPGVPGELVTRPMTPFIGQLGYWRQPDKTWEAHRNAWFHTGDILVKDEDGWFRFVDRAKDALRISGENVSAFEVEQVLISHPRVAEAAVYALPSELGEDEAVAAVVLEGSDPLGAEELIEFVTPRLAYFAVPRYVEFVADLPRTSTQKVQKSVLRERGIGPSTWDGGQRRRNRVT